MKFVARTRLIAWDQWFIDILFLLLLPFLAVWKAVKFAASILSANRARGR